MKPTIKYLLNGEYHYATVKDIGDIEQLKTIVKTDLVSAINSIANGTIPADLMDRIAQMENDIDGIAGLGLNEAQLLEMQKSIATAQQEINAELEARIALLKTQYEERLAEVTSDYDGKVARINSDLADVKTNIQEAEASLEEVGSKLSSVELGVTNVTRSVDEVKGQMLSKVESTAFDLLESTVKESETQILQNKNDIALKASQDSLDLATQRVTEAEAKIEVNAQGITSAVKRNELRKELDDINVFGKNILRNTRDWNEWEANTPANAYVLSETYNHLHIQEQKGSGSYLKYLVEDLVVGKTYNASVWAKSTSNNTKLMLRVDSTQHEMANVNSDIFLGSSWQRVWVAFVATKTEHIIGMSASNVGNSVITQLAGAKIETGAETTGWQAHEDDAYGRVITAESVIKQQADQITSVVSKQEKLGEDVVSQQTEINQLSDSIELTAKSLKEIDGKVTEQEASIKVNTDSIVSKVEQSDIDKSIEGIALDNRNLILNSDFILELENWSSVNEAFKVKDISGKKYLSISRSGLSANLVASASSNMFAVNSGDKLSIGLDVIIADLAQHNVKTLAVLDLFDINDTRVSFKEFNVSDFEGTPRNGVNTRLTNRYVIDREDVSKARLRLTLYRNGSVDYTNITIQKGDIKSIGWTPAPEDSQLIQANMKTAIEQNAQSISLKAESDVVDKLDGRLESTVAELKVANDKISANIEKLTNVDGTLEAHTLELEATAQALSSKMTALQVDEMIADKKFASQSELKQTAEGFTATVGSITSQVKELEEEVESTRYTWIMWADDIQGNGISADSYGKTFMGIAYNKPTIEGSLIPSDYVWTKTSGEDGVSVDDFVTEYNISYSDEVAPESGWTTSVPKRDSGQYLWVRENTLYSNGKSEYIGTRVVTGDKGEDAYKVEVLSTNGDVFKNGIIETWLYAVVYKGGEDVTSEIDSNRFRWTRISSDPASDKIWNEKYFGGVKEVKITVEDVTKRASFNCDLMK